MQGALGSVQMQVRVPSQNTSKSVSCIIEVNVIIYYKELGMRPFKTFCVFSVILSNVIETESTSRIIEVMKAIYSQEN